MAALNIFVFAYINNYIVSTSMFFKNKIVFLEDPLFYEEVKIPERPSL